ncbi:hypothetical protein HDV05_001520 [Chytridiales sp. JEL 0842]|nr:hypothetical protein HDV05_001520 [Chytridiales sp. JEL 0842]
MRTSTISITALAAVASMLQAATAMPTPTGNVNVMATQTMNVMATPTAVALAVPTSMPNTADTTVAQAEPEEADVSEMEPEDGEVAETEPEAIEVASPEEADAETSSPDYEDGEAADFEGAEVASAQEPQDASVASGGYGGHGYGHHGRRRHSYKKKKEAERWRRALIRNRHNNLKGVGEKKDYGTTYYRKKSAYPSSIVAKPACVGSCAYYGSGPVSPLAGLKPEEDITYKKSYYKGGKGAINHQQGIRLRALDDRERYYKKTRI